MTNPNSMRSLATPTMLAKIAKRTGSHVFKKVQDSASRRLEYDWPARMAAAQALIEVAQSAVAPNSTFIAVEHLAAEHYGRKSVEKSKCPTLRDKRSHIGRFILASLYELGDYRVGLSGVLYEDTTRSQQDILIRTKFSVQTDELVDTTRFPDVLEYYDSGLSTDGLSRSSSLSSVTSLTRLLSAAAVSTDIEMITASLNKYQERVTQYNGEPTALVIPLIPRQEVGVESLV